MVTRAGLPLQDVLLSVPGLEERLSAAGKHKRLIIGAVMRKLLVLAFGILRSGMPFDANYA